MPLARRAGLTTLPFVFLKDILKILPVLYKWAKKVNGVQIPYNWDSVLKEKLYLSRS